jgi:hypothetical protein
MISMDEISVMCKMYVVHLTVYVCVQSEHSAVGIALKESLCFYTRRHYKPLHPLCSWSGYGPNWWDDPDRGKLKYSEKNPFLALHFSS